MIWHLGSTSRSVCPLNLTAWWNTMLRTVNTRHLCKKLSQTELYRLDLTINQSLKLLPLKVLKQWDQSSPSAIVRSMYVYGQKGYQVFSFFQMDETKNTTNNISLYLNNKLFIITWVGYERYVKSDTLLTWNPIRFQFSKTSAACEIDTDHILSGSLLSWMSSTEHLECMLKK